MKKIVLFTILMMSLGIMASAQTVTATAVKTTHRNAIAKDVVEKGTLTMKRPSEVSIVVNDGKDQLLMQGSTFTMVVKGKKHVTSSERNPQFASFQKVFESILSGGKKALPVLSDLTVSQKGKLQTLTIVPKAEGKKASKRMMFSSFVMTIDTQTSELKTLRMNERAGYTEYVFSNYQMK